jgi:transcriptional regulator with XRE-family HTH domain
MDAEELGRQVLSRRKEKHWSQGELGDLAGISRNYVSLIERGEADSVSMKVIHQLAVAFGVTVARLTGEVEDQSMVMIPPELREFGLKNNLSYEAIDKLAKIPRRGREPKSVEEWQDLYNAISQFIEGE